MNRFKFSFIFAFCTLIFASLVFADDTKVKTFKPPAVGEKFPSYNLEDAFRKKHTLKPETRRVIMSANMDLSKEINNWIKGKEAGYLEKNKIEYVSDITPMPGIVMWLFARGKMQKYPFKILLADDDDFKEKYGLNDEEITVFDLDENQKVTAIEYIDRIDKIKPLSWENALEVNKVD